MSRGGAVCWESETQRTAPPIAPAGIGPAAITDQEHELPFPPYIIIKELPRPLYLERIGKTPESVRDLRAPHPSWARFLALLHNIGFPQLFEALCAKHPKRGREVPVEKRREALVNTGVLWTYHKRGKFWTMRERTVERAPSRCGLGLDVRIDARVECTLNFATPLGHLGYCYPRLARHARRVSEPEYQPSRKNPAPRIGSFEQLPEILADCLTVYEVIQQAVYRENWEVP